MSDPQMQIFGSEMFMSDILQLSACHWMINKMSNQNTCIDKKNYSKNACLTFRKFQERKCASSGEWA